MSRVDKDIERLIVLHLDGAISEDQELALNRELIRNPDAHRMLDEYKRVDELATAALNEAFGGGLEALEAIGLPDRTEQPLRRRYHRGWWLIPGAVAAALLAFFVAQAPMETSPGSTPIVHNDQQPIPLMPQVGRGPGHGDLMRNVGTALPRVNRNTGREIFGAVGADGNIYWIEVDRTRTIRQRKSRTPDGFAFGEM